MPKLAAFPKLYMQALCKDGTMSLAEWIDLAAELPIDGLEWYAGFIEMQDQENWKSIRNKVEERGLVIPMMCCSPDFTHPDAEFRAQEIEKEKFWIDMTTAMGGKFCRVLSGQRRPDVAREDGIRFAAECIDICAAHAQEQGVTLIIENHYKDDFWTYPEFAQMMDVFCELVAEVKATNFGVNYDPSNTILAGEDPLELLRRVSSRVVTMHASDRFLTEGTIEDLRNEELGVEGYAKRLSHGEVGKGLNDYDAIFSELKRVGFDDNWISIEDGVEGMDQLARSAEFLQRKIHEHWDR
ncbi:MAG: myo-inositol catabolism protein IolH [Rhodopirellula sp.]|nr:myo-inositol catabolism protein IolH [Rhodopirellula sp.]